MPRLRVEVHHRPVDQPAAARPAVPLLHLPGRHDLAARLELEVLQHHHALRLGPPRRGGGRPRAEGVDLEDYKTRFVVTNLKELSQEQQRMVVKMQLKGNVFFDQLVDIAETRKTLDAQYKDLFSRSDLRCVTFHPAYYHVLAPV